MLFREKGGGLKLRHVEEKRKKWQCDRWLAVMEPWVRQEVCGSSRKEEEGSYRLWDEEGTYRMQEQLPPPGCIRTESRSLLGGRSHGRHQLHTWFHSPVHPSAFR